MAQKTILTPHQASFLDLFAKNPLLTKRFYLTGGTALSEFYLHHRESEDIDLFSEDEFPLLPIRSFLGKIAKSCGIQKTEEREFMGLKTFFLTFDDRTVLKVDFNYYPFPRIEKGIKFYSLFVDSIFDIAVNKIHTISMKPRARDFVDIYCIIKKEGYSVRGLLMAAKAKFDWHIDQFHLGSRFLLAKDQMDFPRMLIPLDPREWQNFFIAEAKKLRSEILE